MADTTNAEPGAQEEAAPETTDPFAEFESEAFDRGEPSEVPAEAPAKEADDNAEDPADPGGSDEKADEPVDSENEEAAADEQSKPKKTAQERINELTRARREAERESVDLRRRLEALESRAAPQPPAPTPQEAPAEPGSPDPNDYDFGELDSLYISDLVRHQTDQRIAEFQRSQLEVQEQSAAATRQAEARAKFEQQTELGAQKYDDYEDKVLNGASRGEWPLSEELGQLLVQSDVGEDIAYHLASNPEEAAKIYRQSPMEQARYFGRMEAQFSAAQPAASREVAPPKTPRAPAPVTPARGAGGRFQKSADTDDFESFESVANGE